GAGHPLPVGAAVRGLHQAQPRPGRARLAVAAHRAAVRAAGAGPRPPGAAGAPARAAGRGHRAAVTMRVVVMGAVLLTALLVATVVLPAFAIAGVRPDLVTLTVVGFALADGPD